MWEDEGSLCFQVEAKGVCVARREGTVPRVRHHGLILWLLRSKTRRPADRTTDNHMINGTKLLNVAGMTRGRRDGILKSEKMRHVVKIGPMHLKGVWYVTCSASGVLGADAAAGSRSNVHWSLQIKKRSQSCFTLCLSITSARCSTTQPTKPARTLSWLQPTRRNVAGRRITSSRACAVRKGLSHRRCTTTIP